jgi:hypothetical protein
MEHMSDPENPSETRGRDASGRFAPGNSANPGGRPKGTGMSPEDVEALTKLTPKAWARLEKLLDNDADDNVAMKAIREIFDRKFGRAPQAPEDSAAAEAAFATLLKRLRETGDE